MQVSCVLPYQFLNKPTLHPSKISASPQMTQNGNTKNSKGINFGYYLPVSFSSNRTYSTSKKHLKEIPARFKVTQFENVPCPACGNTMLTQKQFDAFTERIENTEPDEYLDVLSDYTGYMRPIELSVYKDVSKLSDETGVKDLRKLVTMLRSTKLVQLQKIQMHRVREMSRLARTLPSAEKAVLNNKIEDLKKQIHRTNSEAPFRRKIMIDRISKIKIKNPIQQQKLHNIALSFPTSNDLNSAWIVKYSGTNKHNEPWESKDIALRMLQESVPNTDHILAYSTERNHDDISNYLAMHKGCNCQKAAKPFMQWVFENKDGRLDSLDRYFKRVQELIDNEELKNPKYKNYVANATDTIREVTHNKVDITI